MPLTAGEVMESARDRNPAFNRRDHPDPLLLRFLSQYQRALTAEITARNPSLLAEVLEVPFPLAVFDDGVTIPAYERLQGGTVHYTGGDTAISELYLMEYEDATTTRFSFSAYPHQGRLHFAHDAETWEGVASVKVAYTPIPAPLINPSDTFVVPDSAEWALVEQAAAFLGARVGLDLTGRAIQAERAFLAMIGGQRRARTLQKTNVQVR